MSTTTSHVPDAPPADLAKALLRLLADNTDECFIAYDAHWRFVFLNPVAERWLNRPQEELIGRVVWDVFPLLAEGRTMDPARECMRTRRSLQATGFSLIQGQSTRAKIHPTPDGGIAIFLQTLEQQQRSDALLQLSEQRFTTLADLLPELIWTSDPNGGSVWHNQKFREYTGLPLEAAGGEAGYELLHPEDREHSRRIFERARARREPLQLQQRMRTADGSYRWFLVRGQPVLDATGKLVQWVGVSTDVQAMHEALDAERGARTRAESATAELTRIFAEIPFPLAVLRGPEHVYEVVTNAYQKLMNRPLVGRRLRDVFPEAPSERHYELFGRVYQTGEALDLEELRVTIDLDGDGTPEEHFFRVANRALRNELGEIQAVATASVEITPQVQARFETETLRRQADEARAEAESERARLARILAQAPFGVAVSAGPENVITHVNDVMQLTAGARPLVGLAMRDAFPEAGAARVHDILEHVYQSGQTHVMRELEFAWKGGHSVATKPLFVDLVFQPIRKASGEIEGVLTLAVDVSMSVESRRIIAQARDEAERARALAEHTREQLHTILSAVPAVISVMRGPSHVVEFINTVNKDMLGGRDIVGLPIGHAVPELVDLGVPSIIDDVYRTGEIARRIELPLRAPSSATGPERRFYNASWAPLREHGSINGVVAAAIEVTEQVVQRERIETLRAEAEERKRELEQARGQLEERITQRTAQLAETNRALAAEITERIDAEATRTDLLRRLANAREDEQRRTARDLHDQVGQTLTALTLAIQAARDVAPVQPATASRLADVQRIAEELAREVHGMAVRLRPTVLDDFGLQSALRQLLLDWSTRREIEVDFQDARLGDSRLPSDVETVLYRVVQEALTNIARHANARHVSVIVERLDHHVIAVVEDDGIGFDVNAAPGRRLGLVGMAERVSLAAGQLDIESSPSGTTVIARIPVARPVK